MALNFEWDPRKAESNHRKHTVSFLEATTAFADPRSVTISDPAHSFSKSRELLLGKTAQDRLIVVSHTTRGGRIRLISARMASRNERKAYAEEGASNGEEGGHDAR